MAGDSKLYISNLDSGVTNEDIRELFAYIGDLKRYAVHYEKTGRPIGSAEVVYTRRSDAFSALKRYNNVRLDGKPMKIEFVGANAGTPVSTPVTVTGLNGKKKGTVVMTERERIMAGESEVSVTTLSNHQVLDCKVCNQALTIPVFQCNNGHTACKTCCDRLDSKCPTCELKIDSKCLHLEEILQSLKSPCKNKDYGCKELISFNNAKDHEKKCAYECFPCPEPTCQFRGLSRALSHHFFSKHPLHYIKTLKYDDSFGFELRKEQKICVFKEAASGDVFVLHNETAACGGNKISVSFVNPASPISRKEVKVKVTAGSNVLKFCGPAQTARSISDKSQPPPSLIVSSELFGLMESVSVVLKLRRAYDVAPYGKSSNT